MKPRVLVVDDEPRMTAMIVMAFRRPGYACEVRHDGQSALERVEEGGIDVVVTDWKMPGLDGISLLKAIKKHAPSLPVILITAFADVASAVTAMREGAFDYVTKPFDNDELRGLVARALELTRLQRENRYLREQLAARYHIDDIIAVSPQATAALSLARRVAPSRASVLIQGDSGTGKELVARAIHFWSDRVEGPFVAVNCKAFASGVLESELFGHEKGAFTGAHRQKQGCFERAHGGTLLLDEIGEVSEGFQVKLLRVLQEGEVQRVGGSSPQAVDVRVVAATNRDLIAEVREGRFREDLFFRLNVIPIHLAPLKERREDILPLVHHFLSQHSQRRGRPWVLAADTEAALQAHDWPGNIRELENAIERAVLLARSDVIELEDLLLTPIHRARATSSAQHTGTLQETIDEATVGRVRAALEQHGGRRADAASDLGVDRTTLYRLMKRLGINS